MEVAHDGRVHRPSAAQIEAWKRLGRTIIYHPVLWDALIAEWQLVPDEVDYINRQQGCHCMQCGVNLRGMTLALAVMRVFGFTGLFREFVVTDAAQRLRVLEINEANVLMQYFLCIPGHILAVYPERDIVCPENRYERTLLWREDNPGAGATRSWKETGNGRNKRTTTTDKPNSQVEGVDVPALLRPFSVVLLPCSYIVHRSSGKAPIYRLSICGGRNGGRKNRITMAKHRFLMREKCIGSQPEVDLRRTIVAWSNFLHLNEASELV